MVFSTKASKIAADTISSFLNVKSVLILLFAFSLFSFAQAASITSINESFLCQCDTIKQSFSVCADAGGAYSLKAEGQNSNWITFAPSNFNLDAGECMNVYLFSTPSCYSHSGDYNYSIVLSGQESAKTNYKISVIQCHTIGFSAVESSASVNPCDSVYYNFSITNTGKFSDEFVLRQNGLPNDWVSYSREKFVLNPGQSLNSMLKVSPVCSADANIYNFSISAMNTMTNASSSVDLSLQVENYIPFELLDLFNSAGNTFSQKSCEEFDKNIVLNLKNVSNRADTYTIDLLDLNQNIAGKDIGYFGQNTVLVPAGGNIDLNLVIAKHIAGTKQGFLRVHSKEYSKDYTVPFEFVFENCYDFSITRVNPVNKACLNKRLEEFDIANTGSEPLDLNFALFVDNNITESKSLSLGVMESEHVSFQVNPIRAQKSVFDLRAVSAFVSKDINFDFEFENCFGAEIFADNIFYCDGAGVDKNIMIMNTGNRQLSLDVSTNAPWLVVSPSSIVIDANSRESLNIKGLPTGIIASTYSIFAQSPDLTVSKSIAVSKLGDGVCHGFSAVPSVTSIDLTCCTGKVLEVNIKNTGFFNQEFKLSRVSPSWVSFSEESFSLLPNTEKKVFVYFSPDSNSAGAQTAVILVSNDNNVSVFVSVDLNVSSAKNFVIEKNLSLSTSVLDTSTNLLDTSSALGKIFLNIILRNDSNSGFVVNSILVKPVNGSIDFNAVVDFNKGVIVPAGKDFNAILVITFDSNKIKPKDFNAVFVFETSAGVFTKIQLVSLEKTPQSFSITGMFLAYSAPITAILFFGLLVLILLALRRRIDSGSESEE